MKLLIAAGTCAALLVATSFSAPSAQAHATYNISGYGSGLGGSTNGADGSPTSPIPPAEWTNGGVSEYVGNLPVQWYAGVHSATQLRTIQSGLAPNPPSGGLLEQTNTYNTTNDPDLPTDRVIAVAGRSWADPDNEGQGWGHGLDYGLLHFTPLDTILANGPVKFTVTVSDDPSDGVAVRLAFAVYGHWDTSATSERHQTFVTSPTPVNDPLGATGLVLVDYAVATSAGQTITRTFDLDDTYGGQYTVFVGALDGVSGQYQLTVAAAPDVALGLCESDLATSTADADGDGVIDVNDICPSTAAGEAVDAEGCSQAQFCAGFDATTKDGAKACKKADWNNDEPLMKLGAKAGEIDCVVDKGDVKGSADDSCVSTGGPPA